MYVITLSLLLTIGNDKIVNIEIGLLIINAITVLQRIVIYIIYK